MIDLIYREQRLSDMILNAPEDSLENPVLTFSLLRKIFLRLEKESKEVLALINYQTLNNMVATELTALRPFIYQRAFIGLAPPYIKRGGEIWLAPTCRFSIALRLCNEMCVVLGMAKVRIGDPWEAVEGIREYLTNGENIEGCQVESIYCNNS
jgi:hypothetical protein